MPAMIAPIENKARRRRITRLCHFTPSRNLVHIMADERGVLATRHLEADERKLFNPTDPERLDGHLDHVCCSIQYPNAWYFRKARQREKLFPDWVVLLLAPHCLWLSGTKFCPRNAAADDGRLAAEGAQAFEALFAEVVMGAGSYRRGPRHPSFLPTDEQAEVLIPDRISRTDLLGVVVRDISQAKREASRLNQLRLPSPDLFVAPDFFDPKALSKKIRAGFIPPEERYTP